MKRKRKRKIIYIGKTTGNIYKRLWTHFSNVQKYNLNSLWRKEIRYFDYAVVETESDLCLYEVYYINKIKPQYNYRDKCDDKLTVELPNLQFSKIKNIKELGIDLKYYLNKFQKRREELLDNKERINLKDIKEVIDSLPKVYCREFKEAMKEIEFMKYTTRNRLILELMFYLGLKTSEIVNLEISDISLENNFIDLKNRGKGYKLPIHKYLQRTLVKYLDKIAYNDILIKSNQNKKISPRTIQELTKKVINLTPNQIRNIFKEKINNIVDDELITSYIFGVFSQSFRKR